MPPSSCLANVVPYDDKDERRRWGQSGAGCARAGSCACAVAEGLAESLVGPARQTRAPYGGSLLGSPTTVIECVSCTPSPWKTTPLTRGSGGRLFGPQPPRARTMGCTARLLGNHMSQSHAQVSVNCGQQTRNGPRHRMFICRRPVQGVSSASRPERCVVRGT